MKEDISILKENEPIESNFTVKEQELWKKWRFVRANSPEKTQYKNLID